MAWRQMDFIPVKFVKSNPAEKVSFPSKGSCNDCKGTACGDDIKAFYDELVGLDSDNSPTKMRENGEDVQQHDRNFRKVKPASLKIEGKSNKSAKSSSTSIPSTSSFLKAAQEGEIGSILSMLRHGVHIDSVDHYGWTALMCAVQARHEQMVTLLLNHGASKMLATNHGQTALDLARKTKHSKIIQLLEGDDSDSTPNGKLQKLSQPFFCSICQTTFADIEEKSHQTSTIHLFNMKLEPKSIRYQITEANPGFRMMLRSGWNQDTGLGSKSQGQLFPVKTVLKRDRKGLGCRSDASAKVTHFTANDAEAVKKVQTHGREMKLSTSSKKAMKRTKRLEKKKEINFRREFHME